MTFSPRSGRKPYLVFGAPAISDAEIAEVVAVLKSGWIGTGPRVGALEEQFAAYVGVKHAIAVSSATAALHLSLLASNIGPGDEVITTAMTFCATINAIIHCGATPVIVDCNNEMNIDADAVRRKITARTKALLPVHFAGRSCDTGPLAEIAKRNNLKIIGDCAHAIETETNGQKVAAFGDLACLSFYVTKNVTTAEGGMVLTNDDELASRIKTLALHGLSKDAWKRFSDSGFKHYDVVASGFKYNMTDLQAALGLHQLAAVENRWSRRQQIWQRYNEELSGLPIETPAPIAPGTRHAYHLYTILIDDASPLARDQFICRLHDCGIGTGVHYRSIPEFSYYRGTFKWDCEEYPVASDIGRRTVSLPLSASLTDDDVDDVINTVRNVLELRECTVSK